MSYMSEYIKNRYIKLKLKAVEYKGGKCIKCGYDKYYGLSFHHLDPKEKEFEWKMMRKQSWATIIKELDKCSLLCVRCHTEVHHDESELQKMEEFFNKVEKRKSLKNKYGDIIECKGCNQEFKTSHDNKTYCSMECCNKHCNERKFDPSKNELEKIVSEMTMVDAGRHYGVSDSAIRKRCKQLKIVRNIG